MNGEDKKDQLEEKELPSEKKPNAKKLAKRDVVKAFWRWTFFSHANYNYERLQATGVIHALSPIFKKLYGDDEDEMKAALLRHMQFFNTEPHFGGSSVLPSRWKSKRLMARPLLMRLLTG